jgi:hypothetical protein
VENIEYLKTPRALGQQLRSKPMKKIFIIVGLVLAFRAHSQQLETYNSGSLYTDILETNNGTVFAQINSLGIGGSGNIQPLETPYTLNYLRRGPFDFTIPNCTMQISTMFQIRAPILTGLASGLQIGFVQSHTATSFISPGQTGAMSLWVYPVSTALTNGGYQFAEEMDLEIYNGSTLSGNGYGTSTRPILKTGEWYKLTLTITRDSNTTLDLLYRLEDYGTTGTNYVSQKDSLEFQNLFGPIGFPFSYLTSDSTWYPAIAADMDYGPIAIDNTAISAILSSGTTVAAKIDFELDFQTSAGHKSYIEASPDMIQWVIIETVSGTGAAMVRYYPTTSAKRFFRVVQD